MDFLNSFLQDCDNDATSDKIIAYYNDFLEIIKNSNGYFVNKEIAEKIFGQDN